MSLHHFRQPVREQLVCGKKLLVPKRPSILCVGIAYETTTCSSQEWWSHTVHEVPVLVQSSSLLRLENILKLTSNCHMGGQRGDDSSQLPVSLRLS